MPATCRPECIWAAENVWPELLPLLLPVYSHCDCCPLVLHGSQILPWSCLLTARVGLTLTAALPYSILYVLKSLLICFLLFLSPTTLLITDRKGYKCPCWASIDLAICYHLAAADDATVQQLSIVSHPLYTWMVFGWQLNTKSVRCSIWAHLFA